MRSQCRQCTGTSLQANRANASMRLVLCLAPHVPAPTQAWGNAGQPEGAHLRQTHHPEKPFNENDLPLGFVGASSTAFSPPAHAACWVQQLKAVEVAGRHSMQECRPSYRAT